jgi:hypothetical protein
VYNDSKKTIRLNRGLVLAYADLEATHSGRHTVGLDKLFAYHVDTVDSRSRLLEQNLKKYPFLDRSDPKASMSVKEILSSEIDLESSSALNSQERRRLESLLFKHSRSFSVFGEVGDSQHVVKLNLVDESPFFIRPYTVTEDEKKIIDRELQKLVKMGVLQEGLASCTSPVMLVAKKNTTTKRVVSDLRYLNTRIRRQNWPFPLVRDTIQKLGMSGCSVISTVDLKEAFHSLHLDERSRQFTGICSYYGGKSYVYKRLPMGASISPSEFQSFVEKVIDDIPGARDYCIAHMDDLIIFSKDLSTHFTHLDLMLEGLHRHGLKISPKKAKFCKNEVEYMGHIIKMVEGKPCITAMKSKCDAIKQLKIPTNSKEVRSFIGAVNYLSDYIPNLQHLLRPLHKISSKRSNFFWSDDCQSGFEKVKALLCEPPVLMMPRREGVFVLYSDTSRYATGSTLCQIVDGRERIIGYHSKTLPTSAQNYSVSELEYKGLVLNVKAFRNILRSVSFYAVVDHSALVEIQKSKREPPTQRFKKFIQELSDYSFKLAYLPGNQMAMSDMLSRMCLPSDDGGSDEIIRIACLGDSSEALVVTRNQARSQGITLGNPSEFGIQPTTRQASTRSSQSSTQGTSSQSQSSIQSSVQPVQPVSTSESTAGTSSSQGSSTVPSSGIQRNTIPQPAFVPVPNMVPTGVPSMVPTDVTERSSRGESRSLVQNQLRLTGGNMKHDVPADTLIPRNTVGDTSKEAVPSYSPCPELLSRQNSPLFSYFKSNQVVSGHLPKHSEVQKHLSLIKQKCLRDFNIPLKSAEIKREYPTSLYFSGIYKYLKTGELPARRRRAQSIIKNSENYVLIQDLLFRITLFGSDEDLSLQLCIPESHASFVISMYHESLMAMHQGISKTYYTVCQKYFIPGLWDRLTNFIKACSTCQERKVPQDRDNRQVRQPRIFTDYKPFSEIHVDIKSMFPAADGSSYLVIATCVQTRYIIGIPVRNIEATTIAEVLIQRIVFQFGLPERLVTDQGSQFTSQVFKLIMQTLGVNQIFVSPENHGSLVCERSIQSISNLILSQLQGRGRAWCYYVQAACHAYNTFVHVTLGGYSPFELVYLRKPPDWLGIDPDLLNGVKVQYSDYVDRLKSRLRMIGSLVLKYHNEAQERECLKQADSLRKVPSYRAGQLVYFLMPASGALDTNSRKFVVSYVGPVKIKSVLDSTHVILEDMTGRTISGVHHTNRIKPAFIHGKSGVISNIEQLKVDACFCFEEPSFCDSMSDYSIHSCGDVFLVDEDKDYLSENTSCYPESGESLWCTKKRYKNGSLQALFTNRFNPDASVQFTQWYDLDMFPCFQKCAGLRRGQITGSESKFGRMLAY